MNDPQPQPSTFSEVLLTGDFLAAFLPTLEDDALRAYLVMAAHYDPRRRYASLPEDALKQVHVRGPKKALTALLRASLIEDLGKGGPEGRHYLLLHADAQGRHLARRVQPTVAEALAAHREMVEELCAASNQDDSEETREHFFSKYPPLREEYDFFLQKRTPETPPWRLWMELSMFLMSRFEERFGHLKREHWSLFKEASSEILRIHVGLVEHLVKDLLHRAKEIFLERGEAWYVDPGEEAFIELPFVRALARKYHVGPEQVYLDVREAVLARGKALVSLDGEGRLADVELPTTTGLRPEQERIAFRRESELTREERKDMEATATRAGAARRCFVDHLVNVGTTTLAAFAARGRLPSEKTALARITEAVNEATAFSREADLGGGRGLVPPVTEEEVLRCYRERLAATTSPPAGKGI